MAGQQEDVAQKGQRVTKLLYLKQNDTYPRNNYAFSVPPTLKKELTFTTAFLENTCSTFVLLGNLNVTLIPSASVLVIFPPSTFQITVTPVI